MRLISLLLLTTLATLAGCAYENEADLFPAPACSTAPVTYQLTIAPIMQANCVSCHNHANAEGNVQLDDVQQVQVQAQRQSLLRVVTHAPGYPAMPKDAPALSACDIAAIRTWVEAGAPAN